MRILEALQSHVWDGFQRIQQNEIRDNEAYLDSNAERGRFIANVDRLKRYGCENFFFFLKKKMLHRYRFKTFCPRYESIII